MRKLDELDEIITEYEKGRVNRRTFIKKTLGMGLTLSSIYAFLSADKNFVKSAFAQTPPPGKAATFTYCYTTQWMGSWASMYMRQKELWKNYLPAGSKIEWDVQVYGAHIVNTLLAGKAQIGTLGDMPTFVSTTKRDVADLRAVSVNLFSDSGQICSYLLVRSDAPQFKTKEEAIQWLDGKKIGVGGKGSCGDKFVTYLVSKAKIKPEIQYLDPTIVKTNLQAKKIDAAHSWQPHAAQIEHQGYGRLLFTGNLWGAQDGSYNVMRKDFIDSYPEAAKGHLKCEIVGWQIAMKDPYEFVRTIAVELPGFTTKDIWMALYGQNPAHTGSSGPKVTVQMVFDKMVMDSIADGYKFLQSKGAVTVDKPLPGAIYTELIDEVVKEMKIKAPLGPIKVYPPSEFKA